MTGTPTEIAYRYLVQYSRVLCCLCLEEDAQDDFSFPVGVVYATAADNVTRLGMNENSPVTITDGPEDNQLFVSMCGTCANKLMAAFLKRDLEEPL